MQTLLLNLWRGLAVLSSLGAAQLSAIACQPARIEVAVDAGQAAVTNMPLSLKIKIKSESGILCPVDRDYPIHLEASDANGRNVPLSRADVIITRNRSDSSGSDSVVVVPAAGLITIRATSKNLRPGVASVYVRARGIPARHASVVWSKPAALLTANDVVVVAHCASGGQVSANDKDSIIVRADLKNGPLSYDIRLNFPQGRIGWKGIILIPRGAQWGSAEIFSHQTGAVNLNELLSSDPPGVQLDPSGPQTCRGVEFISPAQYADLEFQSSRISYGEPVQLSVMFRDLDYNPVPIDDPSRVTVQVVAGHQPSFSTPALQKNGAVSLICKPNWWGKHQFRLSDSSLKTIAHGGQDGGWSPGPVALSVSFPWVPVLFCLLFGSLGAVLHALYQRRLDSRSLWTRIALGIGGAILIVSVTLEASLLKTDFQPYTLLMLTLSLAGGWSGPAVFNRYAAKLTSAGA